MCFVMCLRFRWHCLARAIFGYHLCVKCFNTCGILKGVTHFIFFLCFFLFPVRFSSSRHDHITLLWMTLNKFLCCWRNPPIIFFVDWADGVSFIQWIRFKHLLNVVVKIFYSPVGAVFRYPGTETFLSFIVITPIAYIQASHLFTQIFLEETDLHLLLVIFDNIISSVMCLLN